eukprot:CAMPEP_0194530192 /NCGR_PEP_ID=MMETSP0253-20130528/67070_1 /TAXON_ID=2966 /ORGANISM="Noctiluca scintillans" /LENGTH=82 /DNA_ID=CAMNT_0039375387 /DNA_START=46 /DNA_END=290 /DNA_ORIENTATION=-
MTLKTVTAAQGATAEFLTSGRRGSWKFHSLSFGLCHTTTLTPTKRITATRQTHVHRIGIDTCLPCLSWRKKHAHMYGAFVTS